MLNNNFVLLAERKQRLRVLKENIKNRNRVTFQLVNPDSSCGHLLHLPDFLLQMLSYISLISLEDSYL